MSNVNAVQTQALHILTSHLNLVTCPMQDMKGCRQYHYMRLLQGVPGLAESCSSRGFRIVFASACGVAIVYGDDIDRQSHIKVEIYHYYYSMSEHIHVCTKPVLIHTFSSNTSGCSSSNGIHHKSDTYIISNTDNATIMQYLKRKELQDILSFAESHGRQVPYIHLRSGAIVSLMDKSDVVFIRQNFVELLSENKEIEQEKCYDVHKKSLVSLANKAKIDKSAQLDEVGKTIVGATNSSRSDMQCNDQIKNVLPYSKLINETITNTKKRRIPNENANIIESSSHNETTSEIICKDKTNILDDDSPEARRRQYSGRRTSRRRTCVSKIITGTGFGCPNCDTILPFTGSEETRNISILVEDIKADLVVKDGSNRFPVQQCMDCGAIVQYQAGIGGVLLKMDESFEKKDDTENVKSKRSKSNDDKLSEHLLKLDLSQKNVLGTPNEDSTHNSSTTPLLVEESDDIKDEYLKRNWELLPLPDVPDNLLENVMKIQDDLKQLKCEVPNTIEKTLQNRAKRIITQRMDQEKLLKMRETEIVLESKRRQESHFRHSNTNMNSSRSSTPNEYDKLYNELVLRTVFVEKVKRRECTRCQCCLCASIESLNSIQNDPSNNITIPIAAVREIDIESIDEENNICFVESKPSKKVLPQGNLSGKQHKLVKQAHIDLAKYKPLLRKLEFSQWYNESGRIFDKAACSKRNIK